MSGLCRTRAGRLLAALATALHGGLAGCQPATPALPEPEPVGPYLRFWSEPGLTETCAGTLPYIDAYVEQLASLHDVPAGFQVDYFWVDEGSDLLLDSCRTDEIHATGCSRENTIVTTLLPHEHELVHAVRSAHGLSELFLEEGAAEVWGQHTDRVFDGLLRVEDGLDAAGDVLPLDYYPTAGMFSAFIVDRFGSGVLADLARQTDPASSRAEVEDAFTTSTGDALGVILDDYYAEGWQCGRSTYRDDSLACAIAPQADCSAAADDGSVTVFIDLSCASEHARGPRDGVVWSEVAFDHPTGSLLTLSISAGLPDGTSFADFGALELVPCGAGCGEDVFSLPVDADLELTLNAGNYLLRASRPTTTLETALPGIEVTLHGLCS